jgi:hypothetical protein
MYTRIASIGAGFPLANALHLAFFSANVKWYTMMSLQIKDLQNSGGERFTP